MCLEFNNHQLWQCRPAEWQLNKCVFDNLVSLSSIPCLAPQEDGEPATTCRLTSLPETRQDHPRPADERDTRSPAQAASHGGPTLPG